MAIIDLTRTLDPDDARRLPPGYEAAAAVLFPTIEYVSPAGRGRDEMCAIFGCTPGDLPAGEGWGNEHITRGGSHLGTRLSSQPAAERPEATGVGADEIRHGRRPPFVSWR